VRMSCSCHSYELKTSMLSMYDMCGDFLCNIRMPTTEAVKDKYKMGFCKKQTSITVRVW
jgi:hypothetical protein